jgi:fumarate hydratase class II
MATFEQARKAISQTINDVADKAKKISAYRKEASRLASLANKRVARLEANDLTDSPAYQMYIKTGGKFGVKGKTHNELQQEVSRLKRFIDMNTSTVKGVTNTLKEMAANTGIRYNNLKELKAQSAKFFELASKVEQYLRTVEDMASAIGYQKIWETINQYVKSGEIDLSNADGDIDGMVRAVTDAIKQYETPIANRTTGKWFKLKDQ